jgi:hypothetical protein
MKAKQNRWHHNAHCRSRIENCRLAEAEDKIEVKTEVQNRSGAASQLKHKLKPQTASSHPVQASVSARPSPSTGPGPLFLSPMSDSHTPRFTQMNREP